MRMHFLKGSKFVWASQSIVGGQLGSMFCNAVLRDYNNHQQTIAALHPRVPCRIQGRRREDLHKNLHLRQSKNVSD